MLLVMHYQIYERLNYYYLQADLNAMHVFLPCDSLVLIQSV